MVWLARCSHVVFASFLSVYKNALKSLINTQSSTFSAIRVAVAVVARRLAVGSGDKLNHFAAHSAYTSCVPLVASRSSRRDYTSAALSALSASCSSTRSRRRSHASTHAPCSTSSLSRSDRHPNARAPYASSRHDAGPSRTRRLSRRQPRCAPNARAGSARTHAVAPPPRPRSSMVSGSALSGRGPGRTLSDSSRLTHRLSSHIL